MPLSQSILSELIALPSVNPMGGPADENSFESRVTDYLEQRCRKIGASLRRETIEPGRDNFVAWLPARDLAAPVMVWEAHQDTVPVDGMTIEPFTARVENGKMFGRGACDVKGGMAAMLAAFERVAGWAERNVNLVLACSINEEFGGSGSQQLAELWNDDAAFPFDRPPQAVIVAEPTNLDVVAAHKGTVRWRVRAKGVAAHSSTPQLGENAIYRMAKAVVRLQQYADEVAPTLSCHDELGTPTLNVGVIHGGASVNIVPEDCWIEIDRRLIPGEQPESAWRHVADYLQQQDCDVVCEAPYLGSSPLPDDRNAELVAQIQSAAAACGWRSERTTAAYCSDASRLAKFPTVVFGPGDIAQAHTCDEWIDLQQLALAEDIFVRLGQGADAPT